MLGRARHRIKCSRQQVSQNPGANRVLTLWTAHELRCMRLAVAQAIAACNPALMAALFRLMSWSSRSRSTARPPPVMRKFRGLGTVPRQELPPECGLRFLCMYPATEALMAQAAR